MNKIDHIGIAVKDIKASDELFSKLLGKNSYKHELVESEGVLTSFFKIGESKIELLQATDKKSPIAKFIDNKGTGLHHLAIEVKDIYSEMSRLKKEGFILLSEEPKKGADNKLICFLHPKSTNGVLIEICQDIK